MGRRRVLPRSFYGRDSLQVAPELLNKVIIRGQRAGRIVEVEAYRGREDPASHAFKGQTERIATMFGRAGHLYVYFTYGMHWCANVVCAQQGVASAVLLRALAPLDGLAEMRSERRAARRDSDLCSGPAKLAQAFGLTRAQDGSDLVRGEIVIADDGTGPPAEPGVGGRLGLSVAREHLWRWWVPGEPNVSRVR